jgi:hypothetical protein
VAQNTTLQELIDRCRRRFDEGNSDYIDSTTGWPELINEAWAALWNELVALDDSYLQAERTLVFPAGTSKVLLPPDFYKLTQVFETTNGVYTPMRRLMPREYGTGSIKYDLRGNYLRLSPAPSVSTTLEIWYVPGVTKLTQPGETLPQWLPAGWDEFIVNYAVVRARFKEQSASAEDVNILLNMLRQRLQNEAVTRDLANPQRVMDADGDYDAWIF